jgi:hypothetical protein
MAAQESAAGEPKERRKSPRAAFIIGGRAGDSGGKRAGGNLGVDPLPGASSLLKTAHCLLGFLLLIRKTYLSSMRECGSGHDRASRRGCVAALKGARNASELGLERIAVGSDDIAWRLNTRPRRTLELVA